MRLVTFQRPGEAPRSGAFLDGDTRIADLLTAHRGRVGSDDPRLASVLAIIEAGQDGLDVAAEAIKAASAQGGAVVDRAAVTLLAPVPQPPQMRDFLCFEKHLVQAFQQARRVRAQQFPDPEAAMAEMERDGTLAVPKAWYERPLYYHPNRLHVVGTDHDVVWPAYSQIMDFELEFGVFIGKAGRDIPRSQAREHIFGISLFNDFSARDEQTRDMPGQLGPGKGKDFEASNAIGPCLVTMDEAGDIDDLAMSVRVNGEEWARGNTAEMRWKFEDCIAHASRGETLFPGEFFGSGTLGGGCGIEHMRFLESGDVVELELEKVGVLRNRVLRSKT